MNESMKPLYNVHLQIIIIMTSSISFHHLNLRTLIKSIAISSLLFLFFTNLQLKWPSSPSSMMTTTTTCSPQPDHRSPTEIRHVGFVVIGSLPTWKWRKNYIEPWWRPNVTRGYLFLDQDPTPEFLPWPATSPPYRISSDLTKLRVYHNLLNPPQVRMFRAVLDMYRQGGEANKGLRWFMVCDDDTLVFVDNLVEVLNKFDHTKYMYIGGNSESVLSNADFSFDMAFGGAGYALSWPLVEALASRLDECIERYARLFVSDHMVQSCLADLGVAVAHQKGIHQIDLHDDISGFLSAHPQAPLLSLHHFDTIAPIFPSMNRSESIQHLMKAARVDQPRLAQQTVCYHRALNWSVSVSWGYSAYIYETIIPRSILVKPFETFKPWIKDTPYPAFMFNTRKLNDSACQSPHTFFFQSVVNATTDRKKSVAVGDRQVVTRYVRKRQGNYLRPCEVAGSRSAGGVEEIRVVSLARSRKKDGVVECCDVDHKVGTSGVGVTIRSCRKDEIIA